MSLGGFLAPVLAALHFAMAILVTLQVLVHHRKVRSSIGWIGLAWLSPIAGPALYYAFGINRVGRRASRIAKVAEGANRPDGQEISILGTPLPPKNIRLLAKLGDASNSLPLVVENGLKLYCNGDEAYPAMLEAIGAARKSVALSSYILADDEGGGPFVDALIAAHERGVAVRVLVDGIGGGYFKAPAVSRLRAAGVMAERFLHEWVPMRMPFINLRNHKKVLVVDGAIGFTGGMNIAGQNLEIAPREVRVRDVHAQVRGPIVGQLMQSFAQDWLFATGDDLRGAVWWPPLLPCGNVTMRGLLSGPDSDVGRLETLFAAAIEQADKRVRIVTPYFLPEDSLLDILGRAAMRGIEVELLVPERSNKAFIDWAMRAHLSLFPVDSIHCYLARAPFDHSKLMTVDGVWSMFGSANWDARSLRLNFEFNLECYGRQTARKIDAIIDEKIIGSRRLTARELKERPLAVKLRDGASRLALPYI